jgi:hypothetical protein
MSGASTHAISGLTVLQPNPSTVSFAFGLAIRRATEFDKFCRQLDISK